MHQPPAVSHLVLRSRWHLRVIATLSALGLVTALGFFLSQSGSWAAVLLVLVSLFTPIPALLAWRKAPTGLLQWDGQYWYWAGFGEAQACQLSPVFDLQSVMLVCVRDEGGAKVWLWLEAVASGGKWMALRRAVFGSQRFQDARVRPGPGNALQEGGWA